MRRAPTPQKHNDDGGQRQQQTATTANQVLLWCLVFLFRCVNSFAVRTAFNPDEYWQSLEVAHNLVFGYGHLTWEWTQAIRGYSHPLLFAIVYKILMLFGIDSAFLVVIAPRLLQAGMATIGDYYLYQLSCKMFDSSTAKWALVCQVLSWFTFYCGIRTLSNSIETTLTTAALSYWPLHRYSDIRRALLFAALACVMRPTNAVLWLPLCLIHLMLCRDKLRFFIVDLLPIGTLALVVSTGIDWICYGRFEIVPWNFIRFNVLQDVGSFYGTHPWHWYLTQGYPTVLFTLLPLALAGCYLSRSYSLALIILWFNFVFSFLSHKEFRFVFPVLPPAITYCGYSLSQLQHSNQQKKSSILRKHRKKLIIASTILLLLNVPMATYFSWFHQRGPIDVMLYLQQVDPPPKEVDFLTSCHATPYYAYLHRNIDMWFPDCTPPMRGESADSVESRRLFKDPLGFVQSRYEHTRLPSHLVMFEPIEVLIQEFLRQHGYVLMKKFFHSLVATEQEEGTTISLYSRISHLSS
eukprot:TRINITY_DN1883_c0_g1_i1.p1 TRINITY_DN1883_c0_g1~~TRINITY_DN1883_c0_g1_i1.p1  ORF type:complete len:522 (-),score=35.79 TRINITY_DN1883_c0_g1_i1:81-1646(-)